MKKIILVIMLMVSLSQATQATEVKSLYSRLGGYDIITFIAKDFHSRLRSDSQLGRFWAYRGTDGLERELKLLVDFICEKAGGSIFYTGRDMPTTHIGMKINESDWVIFMEHLKDTLNKFKVHKKEKVETIQFVESLKSSMVEG